MNDKQGRHRILRNQEIGFGILLACTWLAEILHLPYFFFHDAYAPNWTRAALRTGILLGIWLGIHLQTRRFLKRLHYLEEFLRICPWCRRVDYEGEWVSIENFFGSRFSTQTSHGMCPECSEKLLKHPPQEKHGDRHSSVGKPGPH